MISSGGAPSLGFSVTPAGQPFNPTKLTEGSWPRGNDQIVIDKATAAAATASTSATGSACRRSVPPGSC